MAISSRAANTAPATSSSSSPNKRYLRSSKPVRRRRTRRTDAASAGGRAFPSYDHEAGSRSSTKPSKAWPFVSRRRSNEPRNVRDAARTLSAARRRVAHRFSSSAMSSLGATQRNASSRIAAISSRSNASHPMCGGTPRAIPRKLHLQKSAAGRTAVVHRLAVRCSQVSSRPSVRRVSPRTPHGRTSQDLGSHPERRAAGPDQRGA
jgi:hypothetical protein